MKIEIRNDRAVVSGYVNAVGRDSRPITDVRGKFVEQIEPGAFRASLERSENVDLLLNHDKSKVYASTKDGSLKLTEDSIGLRAEAVLSDAEMIRKARSGEFRGWSFGMYVGDSAMEERAEGIPRRHVKSLNMFEVSLIDKSRIPCYVGTSVECRAEGEDVLAELRYSEEEPEIVEEERSESEPVDYSAVDDVISELRYGALDNVIAELRYNPYHDPSNGRFTSGGGSGGGFSNRVTVYVPNGQKGNKQYIVKGNDGSYYKYDNRSDVGEDYGIEIDLKYAQEMAHKFGSAKYGGTQKTRELFEKYNNEAKSLSAELAKLRKGRKGEMSMGGNLIWESSRAFDPIESKIEELRYNPYHDPSNGRFTSGGGGGGGGVLVVEKGQKGKGYYIVDKNNGEDFDDEEYEKWKSENQPVSNSDDGTPKRFVNNQGWWSRRMKTDYDEIEDKVNKTQSMNVLFRYRNAATQNQTAIKKEIALADINRDPNINTVRLRQYDRKYDSLIKHIDDRIMNDKRLKVSASRAFDPVDSVIEELRYNPYHDPSNGRFTSGGGGGGGGVLVVEKGQKGKGYYVVPSSKFVASKATINVDPNAKMESSVNRLGNSSVEYNQVNNLQTPLTQDEIIAKISGGDMTKGSCSSLALAYIGNEAGYDVLDFRGGSSRDYFSRVSNIREMANSAGGVVFTGKNAIKSTFDTLNTNVVEGKTYYLAVGQHAAVVRKNGGKFEYLELQSKYSDINKFHELTPKTLHDRFSAKKSRTSHGYKLDQTGILIESGQLATNSDFGKILGYINTPAGKQQKGALGNVK